MHINTIFKYIIRRETIHLSTKLQKEKYPTDNQTIKKVDGIFSAYPPHGKAELIMLEAQVRKKNYNNFQVSKENETHHKDYNKTAKMCKDSVDAVFQHYNIVVPVYAIYQNGIKNEKITLI